MHGKRFRFDHSREALMQQWLSLYKDLIGSPYNPRNSSGGRSPYPKSPKHDNPHLRNPDNLLKDNLYPTLLHRDLSPHPVLATHNAPPTPLLSKTMNPQALLKRFASQTHSNPINMTIKADQPHYLMLKPSTLFLLPYLTLTCLILCALSPTTRETLPEKPISRSTHLLKEFVKPHASMVQLHSHLH